jgi:hypothetical protein
LQTFLGTAWVLALAACGSSAKPGATLDGARAGAGGMAGTGGMAGMGGSVAAGMGGAGGMEPPPPEWVTFVNKSGIFAYDANTFPATSTVITLGPPPGSDYLSGVAPVWSPDGKRVMYISGSALLLWDMSGRTPLAPVTLASGLVPQSDTEAISWSRDGQSVAVVNQNGLYTLDPASPTPTLNPVTTADVQVYSWAPAGNGLLYSDAGGVFFTRVTAGVPVTPELVGPLGIQWGLAPDGNHFATWGASDIDFVDATGPALATTLVYSKERTVLTSPAFTPDGSFFVANVVEDGLLYAPTSAPTKFGLLQGTTGGSEIGYSRFNPKRPALSFATTESVTSTPSNNWFVAELSDAMVVPKPIPGSWSMADWLPDGQTLVLENTAHTQLAFMDWSSATPTAASLPVAPSSIEYYAASPDQTLFAYSTQNVIYVATTSNPSAAPGSVTISRSSDDSVTWEWSPDGRYIAVVVTGFNPSKSTVELVRVDGTTPSSPITIGPTVDDYLTGASWPR